jgi:hypothetical protein
MRGANFIAHITILNADVVQGSGNSKRVLTMSKYDFTLNFALAQHDADPAKFVERLLVEGCDDALIGLGQHGRIVLNFTREAANADDAVFSALSDVQRVMPDAKLVEASPDLVGLTDIANLLGFSRQYMRKLVLDSGSEFPLPVHEGKPAIWHLATVLAWFKERKTRKFDEALLGVSRINMQCNSLREAAELDHDLSDRLKGLVA